MQYTTIFGGMLLAPSQVGYNLLAIAANTTIQWSVEQQIAGGNVAAPIIDVNATVGSLSITCPDATLVSPGSSITWNNIGAFTVTIKDNVGGTILSLAPGQAWVTYLTGNTTAAGVWRTFQLGAGVSSVNAASLAGFGIQALGPTLNQSMPVSPQALNYTVAAADQAKLLVWTGGSGTFTLPNPVTAGPNWFIAVKNLGSGTLTLTPAVGNIDATATKVLNSLDSTFIGCDGTQYFTVGFGRAVASSFNFISINVGGGVNYTLSGGQLNQVAYRFTGVLTANIQVIVPNSIQQYWVDNSTTGAFTLSIGTSGQASPPTIPQGNRNICYCDGSNVYPAVTGTVVYPISTVNGGTGLITIAAGSIIFASATNVFSPVANIINPGTMEWSIPTQLYIGASAFPILDATHGIVAYYDRTALEISKGVVPVAKAYVPGDIRRYGGAGDNVTDNTTPINNAYAALNSGGTQPFGAIYFPAGQYMYSTALVFSGQKRPAFIGDGSVQTRLVYNGANTSNDCITIGNGIVGEPGWTISGIGFYSNTVMTGGAGLHAKGLARSHFEDVRCGDQDSNSNFYIGAWLDGADLLTWDGIQCRGSLIGFRVNGQAGLGLADVYIDNGKISKSATGVHIGGSFGGFHIEGVDVINNGTNVRIDNAITGVANREIIFSPACAIDSACTSLDAATFDGINVDIQDTGGSIFFKNTWCASAGTLIRIGASFTGLILMWGSYLYNAFNTFGGNGHAIDVNNANTVLYIEGTYFRNNQGAGVASSVVTSNVILNEPFFAADVVNPVDPNIIANGRTSHSSMNNAIWGSLAIGDRAVWPTAVNGSPISTIAGNAGGIQSWTTSVGNPWWVIAHSRGGSVPGTQGALLVGDQLGGISFEGSDGTAFRSGAQIVSTCTVAPSGSQITANLVFKVNTGAGIAIGRTLSEVFDFFGPAGSTGMTAGWTWIPSSAGPPTGVPAAIAGQVPLHYDRTNNKLYVYNGGWKKGQVTGVDVVYA